MAQVLLGPVIFLAILAILQAATNAKSSASNYNPSSYTLEPLSACQVPYPFIHSEKRVLTIIT